ncbi:UNVERIFIED_CONTAM: hypothetical protein Slati_1363200 [Sesamum latifolium]|uniref:Uncharacterized protein n=1 Tax=Sesamum latifolium TaxID=2727402 RepID=A0AAW2XNR6_9LAMI
MAPNIAGDNSSVEVYEEVLRLGRSAIGPMALGGGGTGTRVDPPPAGVRDVLVATCKPWVLLGASIAFCLFAVLLDSP